MAGHSHWAGIKHKKGKADKQRAAVFSKLSREITVAAKLGDKNPDMNSRLRSAIQAARSANMPKDNIERAIDKSSIAADSNFENIRYEGFGPAKTAIVVITLTDNKNRTASNIRTIFQKHGGGLGTQGSASHNFIQQGIIKVNKNEMDEEKMFDLVTDAGANDCIFHNNYYEIQTNKDEIYDVKNIIEKEITNFIIC
jgi:YebC/PmpR family DNA-binding regulatory protein